MAVPHNLTIENSHQATKELLCFNGSSHGNGFDSDSPSSNEAYSPSLRNGSLYSSSCSPSDSYSKPLCNGTPPKKAQYDSDKPCGIKFVPSEKEYLCGWGAFTPSFLQYFNTPKGVLFFLCVASFLQGMIVNGFINTVITSIERRFDLRSYHSGLIASSYDIAACVCLTFVSYFGGNGHKPQWLGWGALIMGIGSVVFALPHFITSQYEVYFSEQTGMCRSNQTFHCMEGASSLSNYRFLFMFGQFLHGVGATPLYTLGVTYLDENVKSNYSPVYIAIFYTAAIVGPAAGYLLGGIFLNMYTEIGTDTDFTPENPLWVGAWWVGFLGAGGAALLISVPLLGYPQRLPGSQRYVVMRVSEAHQLKDGSHKTASDPDFGMTVKDLPQSVLLLLKNPTFVFLCLAGATEATLIAGMSTFGPKILESQFSLSASEAATLFGYLVVPAGGGGTFLGGFIVNKMKLRCSGIIKFSLLCALISLMAMFVFLIHCPNMPVAGITASYSRSVLADGSLQLTSSCNAECNCSKEIYSPVCGNDNIMYYSPCHAGCSGVRINHADGFKIGTMSLSSAFTSELQNDGVEVLQTYLNCSCIGGNVSMNANEAIAGKCSSSCQKMSVLLIFIFVVILFTFLSSIPALTATLRCVSDRQRSFALGIQWIVVRTFGGIPGPIAFGSLIDVSCLLWQHQCGEQGSCYIYENSAMSQYTLIVGLAYKVMGSLFFLLACILYKPPPESPRSSSDTSDESPSPVKSDTDCTI